MADIAIKDLITDCIEKPLCDNRTGIKTASCFGKQVKVDCENNTVAMTTLKKVNPKTIISELIWMLRGCTDVNQLKEMGCNIWDGNSTEEFLKQRGLNYKNRVIGPGYGFQWRCSGAEYNESGNRVNSGIDQIRNCIELLITNPTSRRINVCSWIPDVISEMALPPCHMFFQFNVDSITNKLDLQMYQRSADIFLGVPYNLTSYSILLCLFAKLTNYNPGQLIISYGNYHIYENHIEQCYTLLNRETKTYGKLSFSSRINELSNIKFKTNKDKINYIMEIIDTISHEDLIITGYRYSPYLYGKMAV